MATPSRSWVCVVTLSFHGATSSGVPSGVALLFGLLGLLGLVHQPEADGLAHGLDPVGDGELAVDVGDMGVDGALREVEAPGHLPGREALGEQAEDLLLPG